MIKKLVKKLFFKKDKNADEEEKSSIISSAKLVKEKANIVSNAVLTSVGKAKEEFFNIKKKCENLLETNYNLGIFHLEKGNLKDAIFRFKFIIKFWPNHYPSMYQLAYCLLIDKKINQAKQVLQDLIKKDPQNQPAIDLLNHIESIPNIISQ